MKKIYSILLCIGLVAGFVACEKDKEFALTTLSINNEVITPAYNSADVRCSFKTDATISDAYVQYALSSSFAKYEVAKMTEEKGIYAAQLVGLADNTTYYIRYEMSNKYSSVVTEEVKAFQTLQCTVPTIVLDTITDVMDSHAKVQIHLTFDGGASVTDMGVCWSTHANPTTKDIHISTEDTLAVLDVTSLQPNTKYYVRAYAQNKVGVAYSEEKEFTTYALPEVRTEDVSDIQVNSALLSATLVFNGNDTATIKGFCWSEKSEPTIEGDHIAIDTASAGYTYALTALLSETQYFVRAYAQNKIGIVYGEEKSFTTNKSVVLPSVTTTAITKITETSAVAGGNVTSDGNATVTERGVVYGIKQNPTTDDNKLSSGSGTGEFTCNLTDLQPNTIYYVRAYATNEKGTAYGEELNFTTSKQIVLPTVTTNAVTQITETTAVAGGNVTSDGNANVTERGVVYSTKQNPTISDNKKLNGSGVGSFVCDLSNLQAGTTYYVRAYAINNKGTAYGDEVSFTTAVPITLATITTASITNITETTAKAGGTVTNDGNAAVTERGVCISTVSNPTTSNTKISAGLGTGSFTCNLTGLQANTTYYVRAYAINSKGTAYGEEVTFITNKQIVLPSVITSAITQITETSAVAGGNVTADGNASVTERGVVYSTEQNPTTDDNKLASGSGTGKFTCNLVDLQPSTTYYVRAYAVNSKGTAYGEQVSFKSSTPNNGTENGYAYVDLGLSVKWATMNVGASKAEEYGDYFAWGETTTKDTYNWSTYKYCNGDYDLLTKYCNNSSYGNFGNNGFTDNKTQLELSDDAARANWGGSWRMPTDAEWTELREQCTWTWTIQNGVYGRNVTSKTNGNSIFLPAAGWRNGSSLYDAGSYGHYWSSSLNADYPNFAWYVYFNSGNVGRSDYYRYYGQSVRPVLGESVVETTIPTVTTTIPTQITETTAWAGGNVTSDGGASVTERGVVYATTQNPTTADNKVSNGSGMGTFACNLTDLQANTTYYVRAYAINSKGTAYGEQVSFTTKEQSYPSDGTENGYAYVDLGLSVKWATMNVGASSPEDYGDYFAWGETTTKGTYNWSTYTLCKGSGSTLTKYNNSSSYGTVDNKTKLELSDDAAHVNWGGSWRMPTYAEMTELHEQCIWSWTTQNSVNGYKVTSKSNGNSIFLPAAGFRNGSSLSSAGSFGYYWSSSFSADSDYPYYAWNVFFDSSYVGRASRPRVEGFTVRPVWGEYVKDTVPTIITTTVTQITETSAVAGGNVTSDGGASMTERGVVYSINQNPTTADNKIPNGSGIGSFTCNLTSLQPNTTYYVRAYAVNSKGTAYGSQVSFTTKEQSSTPNNGTENGYAYVDLGLSVKWATMNVGASSPEDYGDYFAWGETTTKDTYDWSTYKYCNGSSSTLTKYCNNSSYGNFGNNGFTDNKTQLELSDDAARANWGGSWRMPTDAEWTELREQCTWTWTIQNGVYGRNVTSKTNGNSIFLPVAGCRYDSLIDSAGRYGYYWSSSLITDYPSTAWGVYFNSGGVDRSDNYRYYGQSVRPVCP